MTTYITSQQFRGLIYFSLQRELHLPHSLDKTKQSFPVKNLPFPIRLKEYFSRKFCRNKIQLKGRKNKLIPEIVMMEGKKQIDMNTVACTILDVLSPPYEEYECWRVDVKYNSWDNISNGTVYKFSKEEATKVEISYVFQA